VIQHRTRSNPGAEMSDTETKLRNAEWTLFQAKGFGASDEKLKPLQEQVAALRAMCDRPKVVRTRPVKTVIDEPIEHDEQCDIVTWWTRHHKHWNIPALALFAIPNGQILMRSAKNPAAVMNYLKKEGFRDGVSDMMLAVVRPPYAGLFIENKRLKKGGLSTEQRWYMDYFNAAGYKAVMCRGHQAAIDEIKLYLGE
jgi:hypothetical protein